MTGEPLFDGRDDEVRLHGHQVVERPGDAVGVEQDAAPVLQPAVPVLERQVQRRAGIDGQAERPAAGGGGEAEREHEPALTDFRGADEQARAFGDDAGQVVAQRREVLCVEPRTVPHPGEQVELALGVVVAGQPPAFVERLGEGGVVQAVVT